MVIGGGIVDYDDRMPRAFFKALNIPDADINLGVGSGTHAEQVGRTMIEFETFLIFGCSSSGNYFPLRC